MKNGVAEGVASDSHAVLMGNNIGLGPSISVVYVSYMDLDNNFSNKDFSLNQLELKSYRTKQCWPYIIYHIVFFFWIFFTYKNLHIEPFNCAIKSICFESCLTNMGSSVIEVTEVRALLYSTLLFYQFRCHYPLITYLSFEY